MPKSLRYDERELAPLPLPGPPPLADNPGFAAALEVHADALYARALFLARSEADAWDLLQGTLEHALRARTSKVPPENVKRWLTVIMHNHFLDGLRKYDRRAVVPLTDELLSSVPAPEPRAEEAWESIEPQVVSRFVATLPEMMRIAFRMQAEGATYKEIADHLDIPVATVGSRLHRARRRLRKLMLRGLGTTATQVTVADLACRETSQVDLSAPDAVDPDCDCDCDWMMERFVVGAPPRRATAAHA